MVLRSSFNVKFQLFWVYLEVSLTSDLSKNTLLIAKRRLFRVVSIRCFINSQFSSVPYCLKSFVLIYLILLIFCFEWFGYYFVRNGNCEFIKHLIETTLNSRFLAINNVFLLKSVVFDTLNILKTAEI